MPARLDAELQRQGGMVRRVEAGVTVGELADTRTGCGLVNRERVAQGKEPHSFTCDICHSFVADGRIQFLSDCTHALAGQTVDLPAYPA